jgi:hypothetical protein
MFSHPDGFAINDYLVFGLPYSGRGKCGKLLRAEARISKSDGSFSKAEGSESKEQGREIKTFSFRESRLFKGMRRLSAKTSLLLPGPL